MNGLNDQTISLLILLVLVTLPLKIIGLWRSARNNQKWWFGAMVVLNTFGILELLYLFYFSKPTKQHRKRKDADAE